MDHTTNYNLPLYTAQDETNYMTNWNGAMTSIDTAVKAVDDKPVVDQTARNDVEQLQNSFNNLQKISLINFSGGLQNVYSNDNITGVSIVQLATLEPGLYSIRAQVTSGNGAGGYFRMTQNGALNQFAIFIPGKTDVGVGDILAGFISIGAPTIMEFAPPSNNISTLIHINKCLQD